jgi:hypothetical protein
MDIQLDQERTGCLLGFAAAGLTDGRDVGNMASAAVLPLPAPPRHLLAMAALDRSKPRAIDATRIAFHP